MDSFYFFISFTLLLALSSLRRVNGNTELRALMELKSGLDPTNGFLKSWTSDGDPCSGLFEGIACNEHRKVTNITLQGKGLSGILSPAVAELKCLSGIYLHYNLLTGEIPKDISNLTELSELYLNVNNLSGTIPPEIGSMSGLQVLELGRNQLTGGIPTEMGSLKTLTVLSLQHNRLNGEIPASLGNLFMLRRLDLSSNHFFGAIPSVIAAMPKLELLDVRNNSLSGVIPSALQKLGEGFQFGNNQGLCGDGYAKLRVCTPFDNVNINQVDPLGQLTNHTFPDHNTQSTILDTNCYQTHCSKSSKLPQIAIVAGVIISAITVVSIGFLIVFRYRRGKQKIGNTSDSPESRLSTDQSKDYCRSGSSPLVAIEYSNGWNPLGDGREGSRLHVHDQHLSNFRFSLEQIESATQSFSETNLLGKSSFSIVYKGTLIDGSLVAVRIINLTSCKSEEDEFLKGLRLLTSLRHDNLVRLRGFCCSRGRGECLLVYNFASKGNLSKYLDSEDGSNRVLDWPTRVSIINGIAKGIGYLHSREGDKPAIIHRNISVEKILLDEQLNPLIADSGLSKLLADDIVFSTLKVSAAMGYLAPEYVTTGRFTEKSDVFAFGVIILQILTGQQMLSNSMRLAAASCKYEDFMDIHLKGNFSEPEAVKLANIAVSCTQECPEERPTMDVIIQDLSESFDGS